MRSAIVIATALLVAPISAFAADTVQPATPIDREPPAYPDSAGSAEGSVKLSFKIGPDGHVHDAAVLDSTPKGIFDAAALDAVSHWTYRPRTVNGKPVEQPGNAILLRFKPDNPPPERTVTYAPAPFYPEAAYLAKAEGQIVLEFDVTADGDTENIKVTESTTPGLFDEAAIDMIRAARFEPLDDPHAPPTHLSRSVDFKMAEARVKGRPDKIKPPKYPSEAESRGLQGDCDLELTVRKDGTVADPRIQMCYPKGYFERATLDAIKRWKFVPVTGPNGPEETPVHYRMSYRLDSGSNSHYLKPHQWIRLKYTLTVTGGAKDVQVIATSDPGLPTDKAIRQIEETQFTPMTKDGQRIEIPDRTVRIVGPN